MERKEKRNFLKDMKVEAGGYQCSPQISSRPKINMYCCVRKDSGRNKNIRWKALLGHGHHACTWTPASSMGAVRAARGITKTDINPSWSITPNAS